MPSTSASALRYPSSSAAPNVPQDLQNLATDLDQKVRLNVATPTARNALTNTYAGQVVYEQSTGRAYRRNTANNAWNYAGGAPPPIVAATLIAGWDAAAGRSPGCYLDASGLVHIVGAVSPQTAYNPQDGASHTFLTLPTGFRPAINEITVITVGRTVLTLRIGSDGILNIIDGTTSSVAATTIHFLNVPPFHPAYAGVTPLA